MRGVLTAVCAAANGERRTPVAKPITSARRETITETLGRDPCRACGRGGEGPVAVAMRIGLPKAGVTYSQPVLRKR